MNHLKPAEISKSNFVLMLQDVINPGFFYFVDWNDNPIDEVTNCSYE
jgi:hypothetical protein